MKISISPKFAISFLSLVVSSQIAVAGAPHYEKTIVGDFYPPTPQAKSQCPTHSWEQHGWTDQALRRLSATWHPKSFDSRIWLVLTLNKNGQAKSVHIASSSGRSTLDEEAATAAKAVVYSLESADVERISRTPENEDLVIFKSLILDKEAAEFCNTFF